MKLILKDKTIVIESPVKGLEEEFVYLYPHKYMDYYSRRIKTKNLKRVPFIKLNDGSLKFPTEQWIYTIKNIIDKNNWTIDNPEIYKIFSINKKESLIENRYHLWDSQIKCLETLTEKPHGIAILRTGAGKSEMISVLAKNALDKKLKVVVMAPSSGVLQELKDRFSNTFNIDVNYYFDNSKDIQFINPKGLFRSSKFWIHDEYWKDIDVIIFDEVESCMNEKFFNVLDNIPKIKFMYGFSGTANKATGGVLKFNPGKLHSENEINLISYLGLTGWYEKPEDRIVNFVRIGPSLKLGDLTKAERADAWNKVPVKIASNKNYHKIIETLFNEGHVKNLFIPFISRVAIAEFLKNTKRKVGLITGSGFQLVLVPGSKPTKSTLEEIKEKAKSGEIDIILGSKSAFAGIDFPPNWDSSLANSIGNMANASVQAAGRVSRAKEFYLYYFTCRGNVPVFNTQIRQTVKLMKEYYSESEIKESNINMSFLK